MVVLGASRIGQYGVATTSQCEAEGFRSLYGKVAVEDTQLAEKLGVLLERWRSVVKTRLDK
ncbi:MAG: hypothetical protein ACK4SY_08405 [Pyrobaculum sp.]